MKAYGGVDVWIHVFLTAALVRGELSASRPGHFTPEKELSAPTGKEAGWAPEPVWTTWRIENS
jgi:hypothetical protein